MALADLLEQEPQRTGQLVAQDRLVHEAGRACLAVEVASVERGPTAVGPLGQVGQKNMGMKGGIAEATGAVPEGSGHEAVCSLDVDSTMSPTDVTGVALQVRDGGVNASLVAVDHGLGGVRVTQSPYQGHRLGRRQREVEPGKACRRRAQRFVPSRAHAGQHGSKVLDLDPALQADLCRPTPEPPAGRFPDIQVVVLGAIQDLFERYDLLLTPTLAVPPFDNADDGNTVGPSEINGEEVDPLLGWCLTYPINYTGHPAASVPAGFTTEGLPIGMQIVGQRFADETVLAASATFERMRPWHDSYPR